MAPQPVFYENQQPERLLDEVERFRAARIVAAAAPGAEFDRLAEAGEPLIYVVSPTRVLVVCEDVLVAHHSVLANGGRVIAAGRLSLAAYGDAKFALDLDAESGHYRPQRDCRLIVAEILRELGFFVSDDLLGS